MALTYKAIATTTVGSGGAANIEFTSIPGTYTDLLVKISARFDTSFDPNTGAGWVRVTLNSSTSNYTIRSLGGDSTGGYSFSGTNRPSAPMAGTNLTSNTFGSGELYIPNYAGSNNKSLMFDGVEETNASVAYVQMMAALWSDSSAITSIKLEDVTGTNFLQYSTATLYGIKNTV